MSIPTGFQFNYTDPDTGINLPTAWIETDPVLYVHDQYVTLLYNIFLSETAKNNGMSPIFKKRDDIKSTDAAFDTYFALSELNKVNNNIITNSISYLQATL